MVSEAKVHDAPCAMSAQGLTPLVKASEVKHFDGFRVCTKICGTGSSGVDPSLLLHFPRQGNAKWL